MFFVHTSKCCWTKTFSNLSWNLYRREKSGVVTSCPCFRGFSEVTFMVGMESIFPPWEN